MTGADKPEADLIDAMLSAYVDAMAPCTPKEEWNREERRAAIRAAARVMFLLLDAEMNAYPTTPGILVLSRVADEHGLK